MILNGIASVFFEQGKFDMCRKFVTKAYNMAKKANDPEMIKTLALIIKKKNLTKPKNI